MNLSPDSTPFEVEHQRNVELTERLEKIAGEKTLLENELNFLKTALLNKPVIATLTDEQADKLSKAVVYYLKEEVKTLINSNKPMVN